MKTMLQYVKRALWVLVGLIIVSACKKETTHTPSDRDGGNQERVTVLDETVAGYLVADVVDQDTLLRFHSGTPRELLPEVGETIFIPITPTTPYGFLAKVMAVHEDSDIEVVTETPALTDIFEQLSLDTTISLADKLQGAVDDDGKPLDYEVITPLPQANMSRSVQAAGGYFRDHDNIELKIPVKLQASSELSAEGFVMVALDSLNFGIDINNFSLDYFDFRVSPKMGLELAFKAKRATPSDWKQSTLIGAFLFTPIVVPTPAGVPIILRPKIYLYAEYGINGEVSITSKLQYQASSTYNLRYNSGQWSYNARSGDLENEEPFLLSELEAKGSAEAGVKAGVFFGFYTATTGFGADIIPKAKASASFKFSANDLMFSNPSVDLTADISAELYFSAGIFGKTLARYAVATPSYVVWSNKMFLLPQFLNFSATGGGGSTGLVGYQLDSHSLLAELGLAKHGISVFDEAGNVVKEVDSPSDAVPNERGIYDHNIPVDDLQPNMDYFAAPRITFTANDQALYTWTGEKEPFKTDGTYTFNFRCADQTYDVIVFDFALNDDSNNSIYVTAEGQDYNGGPYFNAIVRAEYDKESNRLVGTVEVNFVDGQDRRIDEFAITLGDSGYFNTTKVLDNTGCYSAIAITEKGQQPQQQRVNQNMRLNQSTGVNSNVDGCSGTLAPAR